MKNKLTEQEILTMKGFLLSHVPYHIKFSEHTYGIDLMNRDLELMNYSENLLDGQEINTQLDSYGIDEAFVFDGQYENVLIKIIAETKDTDLKKYCQLSLEVMKILEKYGNHKSTRPPP